MIGSYVPDVYRYTKKEGVWEFELGYEPSVELERLLASFGSRAVRFQSENAVISFAPLGEKSCGWRVRVGDYNVYLAVGEPCEEMRDRVFSFHRTMLNEGYYFPTREFVLASWKKAPLETECADVVATRSRMLGRLVEKWLPPIESCLELGCGGGGNLAGLKQQGVKKVAGIDLNDRALAGSGLSADSFYHGDMVEKIGEIGDSAYDLVFSIGSLMCLHPYTAPDFWERLYRVAGKGVITVENEVNGSVRSWPRDYGWIFDRLGAVEMLSVKNFGADAVNALARLDSQLTELVLDSRLVGYTVRVFMKI